MKPQLDATTESTFADDEDGAISVVNLFFLLAVGMLAGVAIDVSSLVSARSQLQVTADAAAHAALVEREWSDADISKAKAVSLVSANMPPARFGTVLADDNIQFGDYDRATGTFTKDDDSRDAVLVQTHRLTSNGNPVSSFLLQLVGLWDWDVRTTSVFETFYPTCLIEGFVAMGVVDIQSNNSYFNGFCIHSNTHVEINQNNFFEAGTVVSMPDTNDLVVPNNGLDDEKNEGLSDALREGKWFIKILDRLDRIVAGVQDEDSRYARDFTTNFEVVSMSKKTVDPSDFTAGRIYHFPCNNRLTFNAGVYEDIVVISDCKIFIKSAEFHDVVIITKDTGSKAIDSSSNVVMGRADNCGPGGGAQFISYGTVNFSAKLEMHGSQIIAAGDVEFAANADGIRGASIVAGGRVDGTSNMNFAFCGAGMGHVFTAEYFRMAE
ncbi:Tad domain-containing protein [bacterium]|nr:Tad domain-containing protein [bacterium]